MLPLLNLYFTFSFDHTDKKKFDNDADFCRSIGRFSKISCPDPSILISIPCLSMTVLYLTVGQKVAKVRSTGKLESHPCVVTVEEMAAARHFIKTQGMVLQNTDYRKLICIISMELRFCSDRFFYFLGKYMSFEGKY